MNYIDIIIIVVLALAMIFGFSNGLVREVASLASIILGIWGAIKFSSFTAQKLYEFFDINGQYTGIVAFIITFAGIAVIIHFAGIIIDKFVDAMALGFLNKIFGTVFGLLKAALIMSVFFSILNAINAKRPFLPKEKIEQSALYNPIADIAPALFPIIGEGTFEQSFDRFKNKTKDISI